MTGAEIVLEVWKTLPPQVREKFGVKASKKLVRQIIATFYDVIIDATAHGEDVKIMEFAKFWTHFQDAHRIYAGLTGEYKQARAHVRVKILPAKRWRNAVSEGVDSKWKSTATKSKKAKGSKPPAKKGSARSAVRR